MVAGVRSGCSAGKYWKVQSPSIVLAMRPGGDAAQIATVKVVINKMLRNELSVRRDHTVVKCIGAIIR